MVIDKSEFQKIENLLYYMKEAKYEIKGEHLLALAHAANFLYEQLVENKKRVIESDKPKEPKAPKAKKLKVTKQNVDQ